LFNTWHICLFNSKSSSVSSSVSDRRTGLKDFIRIKKISEPIKSEIEEYLADTLDEASLDDDFDILVWWKLKTSKYHVLARLTRDILVVPISTVASESTFNISGRTLNSIRNSLSDESIEALVCGQDWLCMSITDMCCLLSVIWYVLFVICYLLTVLCCMLFVMVENDGEFGDKLWHNDDEAVPNDGICGSEI
jgi:hAT family C-terminal dimerisation region